LYNSGSVTCEAAGCTDKPVSRFQTPWHLRGAVNCGCWSDGEWADISSSCWYRQPRR